MRTSRSRVFQKASSTEAAVVRRKKRGPKDLELKKVVEGDVAADAVVGEYDTEEGEGEEEEVEGVAEEALCWENGRGDVDADARWHEERWLVGWVDMMEY
jgi:hypothetical protein